MNNRLKLPHTAAARAAFEAKEKAEGWPTVTFTRAGDRKLDRSEQSQPASSSNANSTTNTTNELRNT